MSTGSSSGRPGRPFFDSLVGKRIAGRYLVDKQLGSGGMGLVVSAKYPELGQRVAIKFLRPEFAEDSVVNARFLREGRVAAKVKSAHFVRVFDVGKLDNGVPYLVMEMLSGHDLADELKARHPEPLALADAVDLILQAAVALAELHAIGVVHRDLKPSNLFLEKGAGGATVKVLDFGISKEQKKTESIAPLTSTDHMLGTPQYMSPEQIKASKDVDMRSDVWALGVILYELVSQSLPFNAESGGVGEMFGKILYVDAEKLSGKRTDLPDGFEAVVLKCLARDRDQRYASVVELAEALAPFAADASKHRVDAVKKAAATVAEEDDDDPVVEIADGTSLATTQGRTPDAKRVELATAPTAPASKRHLKAAGVADVDTPDPNKPVTAMTSSSKIAITPIAPSEKPKSRIWMLAVAAILVVGAGFGIVAFAKSGSSPDPSTSANATTAAASAPSATEIASAPPFVPPSAEPIVLPSAVASTAANPSTTARPRTPPPSTGAGVAATARPTPRPTTPASAPTLILDRK